MLRERSQIYVMSNNYSNNFNINNSNFNMNNSNININKMNINSIKNRNKKIPKSLHI